LRHPLAPGVVAVVGLLCACGAGADLTEPTVGSIEVTISVTGTAPEPSPYTLTLDGGEPRPIDTGAPSVLLHLLPGDHLLKLGGLSANCVVGGRNPVTLTVVAGRPVQVTFAVKCSSPPGTASLAVRVLTSGTDLDPDGYTLLVDPLAYRSVQVIDSALFEDLSIGLHAVRLDGLAGNCEVRGENPLTIDLVAAGSAAEFQVSCWTPRRGNIAFRRLEIDFERRVDLFLQAADGSSLLRLTETPAVEEVGLTWSPDGRTLAFVAEDAGRGGTTIFLMDRDDGSVRPIGDGGGPVWSPDSRQLLFDDVEGTRVIDLLTGRTTTVPVDNDSEFIQGAAWSPDSRHVALGVNPFVSDPFVRIVELATSQTRTITPPTLMPDAPNASYTVLAWSPDGTKVLVEASLRDDELFLLDVESAALPINLTNDRAHYSAVSWSPDGSTLLFVKRARGADFGQENVYTLRVDDLSLIKVTRTTAEYDDPAWSPDGAAIVYAQQKEGFGLTAALWIVNADGTGLRQLTGSPFLDGMPSWTP
jgi:Tol biopolymer transport system component